MLPKYKHLELQVGTSLGDGLMLFIFWYSATQKKSSNNYKVLWINANPHLFKAFPSKFFS